MKDDFIYSHRVRYSDTDKMGIVYHGRYFEWFEAARTELMRVWGMSYNDLENRGISLPVIHASCSYIKPFTYDEIALVRTWIQSVSRSKLVMSYELFTADDTKIRITGSTTHCYMNSTGRAVRGPAELIGFFEKCKGDPEQDKEAGYA